MSVLECTFLDFLYSLCFPSFPPSFHCHYYYFAYTVIIRTTLSYHINRLIMHKSSPFASAFFFSIYLVNWVKRESSYVLSYYNNISFNGDKLHRDRITRTGTLGTQWESLHRRRRRRFLLLVLVSYILLHTITHLPSLLGVYYAYQPTPIHHASVCRYRNTSVKTPAGKVDLIYIIPPIMIYNIKGKRHHVCKSKPKNE